MSELVDEMDLKSIGESLRAGSSPAPGTKYVSYRPSELHSGVFVIKGLALVGAVRQGRVLEIDLARAIALLLMMAFHFVVDLSDFMAVPVDYRAGFWYYIGKIAGTMFIVVAGVSSTFSRNNVRRGLIIMFWGLVITLVTFLVIPDLYIKWGILHFLGASMILYPLWARVPSGWLLVLGLVAIAVGQLFFPAWQGNCQMLFPLGLTTASFRSYDFYPLFPWIGVYLLGVWAGRILYPTKRSFIRVSPGSSWLSFLGQHTLVIYLLHQPVFLTVLFIVQAFSSCF